MTDDFADELAHQEGKTMSKDQLRHTADQAAEFLKFARILLRSKKAKDPDAYPVLRSRLKQSGKELRRSLIDMSKQG